MQLLNEMLWMMANLCHHDGCAYHLAKENLAHQIYMIAKSYYEKFTF